MNLIKRSQSGFGHILMLGLIVSIVLIIGSVAYHVKNSSSQKNAAANTTAVRKKSAATSTTPLAQAAGTPATTTSTTAPSTKPTSTTKPSSTTSTGTTTPAASSSSTPSPAPSSSCSAPGLKFYTALGCLPASDLYNVKVPPPSNQQPNMSIYACIQWTGAHTAYLSSIATLSYSVPQSNLPAYYADLDLSSSSGSDNIWQTKTTTYSYYNNSWAVGSSGLQQTTIQTDPFNPDVTGDFYPWGGGSYNSSNLTMQPVSYHQNVKNLQSCS